MIQLIPNQVYRLQLAKTAYARITDTNNFSLVSNLLNSQNSRNELATYIATVSNSSSTNNGNYNNGNYTPISQANFSSLYQNIQNQWSSSSKYTSLRDAFANTTNYFSTSQARQLLLLISDESNKLELAKSSFRNITDPANFSQLYDVFNNQASRNELAVFTGNTSYANSNSTTTYNNRNYTPMSDANFTAMYQNLQNQWIPGKKYSLLKDAFANTANYFTTAQAKQLIQMVSDEYNRLDLAKASYRNITDPASFSQINDLLNTQISRDQLTEYVRTYKY